MHDQVLQSRLVLQHHEHNDVAVWTQIGARIEEPRQITLGPLGVLGRLFACLMGSEGAIRIGLPSVQFSGAVQKEKSGLLVQLEKYIELRPEFVGGILGPEAVRIQKQHAKDCGSQHRITDTCESLRECRHCNCKSGRGVLTMVADEGTIWLQTVGWWEWNPTLRSIQVSTRTLTPRPLKCLCSRLGSHGQRLVLTVGLSSPAHDHRKLRGDRG